ncbi:MAG: 16S rRNA (cytosine(1402)-N(4))-methyltransferase RsmH [Bacteroidota bacterium]|nr:MAG: 16S rRNA (cytosine(1402)-N(4))-methyltransferase RsmH [Bacteroidota bacterium]
MTDYHQPVLLQESVDGLNIKPDGIYVDATFGGGGHSREILKRLKGGKLVGFDQDTDAKQNLIDDDRFLFAHHNFSYLKNFLDYFEIDAIDGLLADLGVSSHHFDKADRGFSYRFDAPVDMRMNQQAAFSAFDLLNTYTFEQLAKIFREYGELNHPAKLANELISYRNQKPIEQTRDLLEALSSSMPRQAENQFLAKVYQALRIEVNREMDNLKSLLLQARDVLKPGGRLVVISYHSLEDRLVKDFIRDGSFEKDESIDLYGNKKEVFRALNKKVIVPGEEEIRTNNRARSAKLRIAEKN